MRSFNHIPSISFKLFADLAGVKIPLALVGAIFGYFFPTAALQNAVYACFAIVLLDTASGVVAAGRIGEAITSAKFGRVLVKIFAYLSVVMVAGLVTRNVPGLDALQGFLVTGILSYIIVTEGISVLENVKKLGFSVPFGIDRWLEARIETVTHDRRSEDRPE